MCVRWADPADLQSKWFCGQGNLADGVTGNVTINGTSSYRTWVLPQIAWGANTWDHHWEWAAGLGPVQKRIPAGLQTGFAHDDAWNLNPRDYHADGRTKGADYIAGIVLKTTTWRSGVNVSPYTTRSVQNYMCNLSKLPTQAFTSANCPGIPFNSASGGTMQVPAASAFDPRAIAQLHPDELNQGEAETRSCGTDPSLCFDYFNYIDITSLGTIGNGPGSGHNGEFLGLVDLKTSVWYQTASQTPVTCSWFSDWNLSTMPSYAWNNAITWAAAPYNGTVKKNLRLPNQAYTLAINRQTSVTSERCPNWTFCDGSTRPGPHKAILLPYDDSWNLLPAGTNTLLNTPAPLTCSGVAETCKALLCGQAIAAQAPSAMDWFICAGPDCRTGAGSWSLACQNTTQCTLTMADQDVYFVSAPLSLEPALTDPAQAAADLGWMVVNGGL